MVDFYAVSFELICCQFQFQHFIWMFLLKQTILPRYQIFFVCFKCSRPSKFNALWPINTTKLKCARPSNL